MAQMRAEKNERDAKARVEDARAARENKSFAESLEGGRVRERRIAREKERGKENSGGGVDVQRTFRQVGVVGMKRSEEETGRVKSGNSSKKGEVDGETKRVLGKIF